jgi:hypothetical protein
MNNEPVAWMLKTPTGSFLVFDKVEHPVNEDSSWIPLYTHPAKTLTEENHEWDRGVWTVGVDGMTKEFIESSDFHHDVRLYLNGDFETDTQRLNYLQHIADRLNTHPAKTLTGAVGSLSDEEIGNIANEVFGEFNWSKRVLTFARAILRKAQENPLQDKLDAIANKVVFGKAQEK